MYLSKKMEIFLIVMLLTLLTGCGGGSGDSSTQTVSFKVLQQGEVTDSVTGRPLENVKVTIGHYTTTTNAQGFYEFTDIVSSDKAVLTFEHESYYTNSEIIALKQSANYLEFALDKYDDSKNDNSENEQMWSGDFGIQIPGGIYTNKEGNNYNGRVIADVAYEDVLTEKGRNVFPGAYKGRNSNDIIVPFVSYGFMVIDLKDEFGTALSISGDIVLTFHIALEATAEIIPLWYYDYAQGVWTEEGYATRLADGKYEGLVSRPGTWSLSQPIEDDSAIYTDRIVYQDGTPVKNLRVYAVGKNWISSDLSTDENGVLELEVIPGEEFELEVYHYEDKYNAKFNGIIKAISSGEVANKIN